PRLAHDCPPKLRSRPGSAPLHSASRACSRPPALCKHQSAAGSPASDKQSYPPAQRTSPNVCTVRFGWTRESAPRRSVCREESPFGFVQPNQDWLSILPESCDGIARWLPSAIGNPLGPANNNQHLKSCDL